jgi:transcriptional regulator with XRE-family HTH domain
MYGTSLLWPEFIARLRGEPAAGAVQLAALRQRRGHTQTEVAQALGISQSDVSKLERRADLRVSTLQRYVAALGGELRLTAAFPPSDADGSSSTIELDVSGPGRRSPRA